MELTWLEDFVAVARLRNFSGAARTRHATQPALSRRVKALENWYGVPLIDRSRYPVALTPAGEQFIVLAKQIIEDLYRHRQVARKSQSSAHRTIRFVMPHSLAGAFFPRWWCHQAHENWTTIVTTANFNECVEILQSGAADFLICWRNDTAPDALEQHAIECANIGIDRLMPVSGCTADGSPVYDLNSGMPSKIPLLGYNETSFLGRVTRSLHDRLEMRENVMLRFEAALVEPLKVLTLLGEGVAWLPELTILRELEAGLLKQVGNGVLVEALRISLCRLATREIDADDPLEYVWTHVR